MRTQHKRRQPAPAPPIDFAGINAAALAALPRLLRQWLPGGVEKRGEYLARNPRRDDRSPGSFRVNLKTGRWADFAIAGASGGDAVSLRAYLDGSRQYEAALKLAEMLGTTGAVR